MFFEKRNPVRMCVCCRARFFQKVLIRLKIHDGRLIFFDGFGRSLYLCKACLDHDRVIQSILRLKQIKKDRERVYLSIQEIRTQCHKK